MQKHRVYNDGKTHAECIVENCEAKICSCKDPCFKNPRHPTRTRGKPGPFCMEHHNQLVDLKVCRLPVAAFGTHTVGFALGG